jgi:3-hydroxyisobutyrate dehydrogenase-like beta-hydroxyacid dehydrogenase
VDAASDQEGGTVRAASDVRVTVLGLGNMGSALHAALLAAGHDATGWTRSTATISAAAACSGAELVIACVSDYDATREILRADGVLEALGGSTLVQLASGGPADARALASELPADVGYLDGAIATYPARIGDEPTIIFYAGERAAFDRHRGTLSALGGRPTFVGEAIGGAAAADLAWLSFLYGNMLGLLQGAAFLEAEGAAAAVVFDAVPSFAIEIAAEADYARTLIERGDFAGEQATLEVHLAAMEHIAAAAETGGVCTAFPRLIRDLTTDAVAAGHGQEEIAALIEVLRRRPGTAR